MNPKALQELIKNLQVFYRCPSCSADYPGENIRFLGKVDQHCFIQLQCTQCSLPVLATVLLSMPQPVKKTRRKIVQGSNVGKLGFDASRRERSKFFSQGAISSHEIADFYAFLSAKS